MDIASVGARLTRSLQQALAEAHRARLEFLREDLFHGYAGPVPPPGACWTPAFAGSSGRRHRTAPAS